MDVVNDSGIPMEGVVEKEEEPAKQEEAVEEVNLFFIRIMSNFNIGQRG